MSRRNFQRNAPSRNIKKLFVIACEGEKTEPSYFNHFRHPEASLQIKVLTPKHSSPNHVLNKLIGYIKDFGLKPSDEAWLVIDKDSWSTSEINTLFHWTQKARNRFLAVSNPKFELWLLMHFEPVGKQILSKECDQKLKKHLPIQKKQIPAGQFTKEQIEKAIDHAKAADTPRCQEWPQTSGATTVYRLIEKLIC